MSHTSQKTKIGIRAFLFTVLFGLAAIVNVPLRAVEASLLPNAVQQYFDNNGNPLSSGKVYFYEVGTTTFKDTYTSSEATTTYTNPIILNAAGRPPGASGIYGVGLYRQIVKDRNNNLIWDAVTAPGGGGATPTNVGDGNLVATILPWSGLTAPNQYVFAYGQEIARDDYPEFFTAVVQTSNVVCSVGSNILTGLSDTTQIKIGAAVEVSLCVVPGTTVVSKTTTSVTVSNVASVSINTSAKFFPWGNGDGNATFNVPDLRDQALAGRPNMGGTDRGLITSTYFGANPNGLGISGGNQTSSTTISQANLPNINFTVTIPAGQGNHDHTGSVPIGSVSQYGAGGNGPAYGAPGPTSVTVNANTLPAMSGTAASGGTGTALAVGTIQPTTMINYVIKITPDTSSSSASGVASIGGMTGVISCGSGILCTGNIISSTFTAVEPIAISGNIISLNSSSVANRILLSGASVSTAPTYSTATYPDTATAGSMIFATATNTLSASNTPTLGANGGVGGQLTLRGSTSGSVAVKVPAAAGTTTFQLPGTNGTNGYLLTTDGNGITSWAAGTGFSFPGITFSGANPNAKFLHSGSLTNGSPTLVSASTCAPRDCATFAVTDIGKSIQCTSAGTYNQTLFSTTIVGFTSNTTVTLNSNSPFTSTTTFCQWGTDNTTTINNEIAALTNGGTLILPCGYIMVSSINMTGRASTKLAGCMNGVNNVLSNLYPGVGTVIVNNQATYCTIDATGSNQPTFEDLQIGHIYSPVTAKCSLLFAQDNTGSLFAERLIANRIYTSGFSPISVYFYGAAWTSIRDSKIQSYASDPIGFYTTSENSVAMTSAYKTIATGIQNRGGGLLESVEIHASPQPDALNNGVGLYAKGGIALVTGRSVSIDAQTNSGAVRIEPDSSSNIAANWSFDTLTIYSEHSFISATCWTVTSGTFATLYLSNYSCTATAPKSGNITHGTAFQAP